MNIKEGTMEWAIAVMRNGEKVRRKVWPEKRRHLWIDPSGRIRTQDDVVYSDIYADMDATDWELAAVLSPAERRGKAVELAVKYGQIDGADHKMWVIDQMVRALTGPGYERVVREAKAGPDGPDTYPWDVGVAP